MMTIRSFPHDLRQVASRLRACDSGMAIIEMAFVTPVLLLLGLGGMEIATMATAKMRVSQQALVIADNVARLGQTDNSGITPTITEAGVDSILDAAMREAAGVDLQGRGRIIVSSLERDGPSNRRYIHWQRCRGDLDRDSAYGNDSNTSGLTGAVLPEVGRGAAKFVPEVDQAIIIVEVYYEHEGAISGYFLEGTQEFVEEAGLQVRDDRNLEPGLTGGGSRSSCS